MDADATPGSEGSSVATVHPVAINHHPQRRGRPRKVIDATYLQEAMHPSRNISKTQLARALGMHRNTLRKKMVESGVHSKHSSIEDTDLDALIRTYKIQKPDAGVRYVRGYLRSVGLYIQKQRVLDSLKRVDRIGRFIRRRAVIRRRRYFSSRPNALWHCDGHHKLIKYGFVIHGFIDGNCRTVCHLVSLVFSVILTLFTYLRLLPSVQTRIIMRAQFSSYSYWL